MTQVSSSRRWLTVTDPNQARALTDPAVLKYLEPFIARERTIKQVADELKLNLEAIYYQVKQLERLGLLTVVRQEARAGRATRIYSAVADGFFIPNRAEPLEAFMDRVDAHFNRQLQRGLIRTATALSGSETWGTRVFRNEHGQYQVDTAPGPDRGFDLNAPHFPPVVASWLPISLNFEDAKALQHELMAVFSRYYNRSGSQPYLMRIALTPVRDD